MLLKSALFLEMAGVRNAQSGDKVLCYLLDELGSPIRLMNDHGHERDVMSYDEFGNSLRPSYSNQVFGFTGYELSDDISGTLHAQARQYDPSTGRFISEDFVKEFGRAPFTLNRYSYCWNDPLNLVDLNGLFPFPWDWEGIFEGAGAIIDGIYAEYMLRLYLQMLHGSQVQPGMSIPGSGPKGGTGRPDIVFDSGIGAPLQIYEVGAFHTYGPGGARPDAKREQLQRYIDGLTRMEIMAIHGSALDDDIVNMPLIPSLMNSGMLIEFLICDSNPGVVLWRYRERGDFEWRYDRSPSGFLAGLITMAALAAIVAGNCEETPTQQPAYAIRPEIEIQPIPVEDIVTIGGLAATGYAIVNAGKRAVNRGGSFFLFTEEALREHMCNTGFREFCDINDIMK